MTEFSFDRAQLDSLAAADNASASLAADTAEILAGYYQQVARAVVDRTGSHPPPPKLTPEQRDLARQTQFIMAGAAPGTIAGRAATKIFMAAQMDFYRQNPQYIAAFVGKPADLLAHMENLHASLPPTYEPVDRYYDEAFQNIKAAATLLQDPPGPRPGGPA